MKTGDEVEVNRVWAYAHPEPLKSWFKGYVFVRQEGDNAIVKHSEGFYKDIEVRYPITDVRKEK